jgi:hypothetical protein
VKPVLAIACVLAGSGCQLFYEVPPDDAARGDGRTGGTDAGSGVSASAQFVQSAFGTTPDNPAKPLVVSLPDPVEQGDLLVVSVATYFTTVAVLADTLPGDSYAAAFKAQPTLQSDGGPPSQLSMYYAVAQGKGAYTLTVTPGSPNADDGITASVLVYRGAESFESAAVGSGRSSDHMVSCAPLAPQHANDLDVAAVVVDGTYMLASGPGYQLRGTSLVDDDCDPTLATEDGMGQSGATFALTDEGGWVCGVAAFH